jgi:hypothetical protein
VLWCTCTARYSTDKTTASEPINCEIALTASQFIVVATKCFAFPDRKTFCH